MIFDWLRDVTWDVQIVEATDWLVNLGPNATRLDYSARRPNHLESNSKTSSHRKSEILAVATVEFIRVRHFLNPLPIAP